MNTIRIATYCLALCAVANLATREYLSAVAFALLAGGLFWVDSNEALAPKDEPTYRPVTPYVIPPEEYEQIQIGPARTGSTALYVVMAREEAERQANEAQSQGENPESA